MVAHRYGVPVVVGSSPAAPTPPFCLRDTGNVRPWAASASRFDIARLPAGARCAMMLLSKAAGLALRFSCLS